MRYCVSMHHASIDWLEGAGWQLRAGAAWNGRSVLANVGCLQQLELPRHRQRRCHQLDGIKWVDVSVHASINALVGVCFQAHRLSWRYIALRKLTRLTSLSPQSHANTDSGAVYRQTWCGSKWGQCVDHVDCINCVRTLGTWVNAMRDISALPASFVHPFPYPTWQNSYMILLRNWRP